MVAAAALGSAAPNANAGEISPFASQVISYAAGSGAAGNDNPLAAIGSPTRFTGVQYGFAGPVNPFNPSFDPDETVTIGRGGSIVLAFDHQVRNDAANPYGIDLLVFGNSFFYDPVNFDTRADALASEGGTIDVSQDGQHWFAIHGVEADGLFPTLGYSDLTDPYGSDPGQALTDFTKPVDPNFDWRGKNFSQILAGYNGSGGGAGVDIGSVGLDWIQYIRISNASNASGTPEIDAVSDVAPVPSPGAGVCALLVSACVSGRRRREASL